MTTGNSTSGLDISKGSIAARVTAPAPLWATVIATFFGVGRLRPGPGSWGSAATVLLWAIVAHSISATSQPAAASVLVLIVVLIGIPAATRVSRASGLKDPQFVVIDEVAGQLISFIGIPISWKTLLTGFIQTADPSGRRRGIRAWRQGFR